jgi:hypothetical protein
MLERLEKRPGPTPAMFHPPIFAKTASISWFCVSPPPPLGTPRGVFIYDFLGQAEQSGAKMDDIGGSGDNRHLVGRLG